ncbi:MAG: hypothetical protein KGZ39_00890 [Simkania sp.]|nr:hypothetical protein [Simkania sp.]
MRKFWVLLAGVLSMGSLSSNEALITPQLCELLEITHVQCDKTLPSIVEATQKFWLRPTGQERWEIQERSDPEEQARIVELCRQIGLFSEVSPQTTHYRYCCILGAALPTVQKRLQYAAQLWLKGVRFDELVFLTGDRPLDHRVDRLSLLEELPQNETEGMLKIFEVMDLPQEIKDLPLTVIDTPKQPIEQGLRRPNVSDTISCWVGQAPTPGNCLFISNQPYICYQAAVVRGLMPKTFLSETVGPTTSITPYLRANLLLDTIARWLYQESKN